MEEHLVSIGFQSEQVCPVCGSTTQSKPKFVEHLGSRDISPRQIHICPRCGTFEIDDICAIHAADPRGELGPLGGRARSDLSALIRERQNRHGPTIFLTRDFFNLKVHDPLGDIFRVRPNLSFTNRADKLLKVLANELPEVGYELPILDIDKSYQAKAWILDDDEWDAIIEYLLASHRIIRRGALNAPSFTILPSGWERIEELEKNHTDLERGFVAMWFDEEMNRLYNEAIFPAICLSGYTPIRIDEHPGEERIVNRIELEIKESRFIVADFTGHRGGVYFEAGFARALGKPVFFTCHKDEFEDMHFDTEQFACLRWDCYSLDKLRDDLRFSIENVSGKGPVPINENYCLGKIK